MPIDVTLEMPASLTVEADRKWLELNLAQQSVWLDARLSGASLSRSTSRTEMARSRLCSWYDPLSLARTSERGRANDEVLSEAVIEVS